MDSRFIKVLYEIGTNGLFLSTLKSRSIQLRRRLDALLTFYLDKGSSTELAEVGLEALQYPGRV